MVVDTLLFGHRNKLQIDLGDLEEQKEPLISFLSSTFNATVTSSGIKIILDSEKISVLDLQQAVKKFVHRYNLSRTHWVSVKDKTVQINRFKVSNKKKEKNKKNKPHQTLAQSWGL